jgi:hypothetical protein
VRLEGAWEAYLPGQNASRTPIDDSEASKSRNADGTGTTRDFQSVAANSGDGSKNDNLAYSHASFDVSTFQKGQNGREGILTSASTSAEQQRTSGGSRHLEMPDIPDFLRRPAPRAAPTDSNGARFRVVPLDRRPALGPPGDSLDDFR